MKPLGGIVVDRDGKHSGRKVPQRKGRAALGKKDCGGEALVRMLLPVGLLMESSKIRPLLSPPSNPRRRALWCPDSVLSHIWVWVAENDAF